MKNQNWLIINHEVFFEYLYSLSLSFRRNLYNAALKHESRFLRNDKDAVKFNNEPKNIEHENHKTTKYNHHKL